MSLIPRPAPDWDFYNQILRNAPHLMGIGEAAQQEQKLMANIRIEPIENGYLIVYWKQGVKEERRFAKDMKDVGEAVIAACIKLELTGK